VITEDAINSVARFGKRSGQNVVKGRRIGSEFEARSRSGSTQATIDVNQR
jgi:hypothetical protein